eukprot:4018776-Pyramimonas_sp.AAC.1
MLPRSTGRPSSRRCVARLRPRGVPASRRGEAGGSRSPGCLTHAGVAFGGVLGPAIRPGITMLSARP